MAINTNFSSTSATSTADILGRSLNKLSQQKPKIEFFDELAVSSKFNAQRQQAQSDLAEVQNSVSTAQSADGQLRQVSDVLAQMSDLADQGDASLQPKFKELQDQLRALIGTAAPAGGNQAQALIAQNDDGSYATTLSSSDLGATLKAAQQEISATREGLAHGLSRLQQRAAALQIEYTNLNSAVTSLQSEDDANSATQFAKYALLGQSSSALSVQTAGSNTSATFKLLAE